MRNTLIFCLVILVLHVPMSWAGRDLLGSSGPVDRPTVWAARWMASADYNGPIMFVATDSIAYVEFIATSARIDGVFLDGPGGLDGPTGPGDNRWYEILQYGSPTAPSFYVPNMNYAVLGSDEIYQNYPDTASLGDWSGAQWTSESAPDSMAAFVDLENFIGQVSFTGSALIGRDPSGAKVSTLTLRNLVPGAEYTLSFISLFGGLSDHDWECPVTPSFTFYNALLNRNRYNLWVNIYAENTTIPSVCELSMFPPADSGCPLPSGADRSRFYFKDDWLILRGAPDATILGDCSTIELEVWRREGNAMVWKGLIPVPLLAQFDQDFGASIAIDNNVMVVGSPQMPSSQSTAGGSAYLYVFDGDSWEYRKELKYAGDWDVDTSPGYASNVAYLAKTLFIWNSDTQILQTHENPQDDWVFLSSTSTGFDLNGPNFGELMEPYVSAIDGTHILISSSFESACLDSVGAVMEYIRNTASEITIGHPFPSLNYYSNQWAVDNFSQDMDVSMLRQVFGIPNHDKAGAGSGMVWVRHRDNETEAWVDSYLYPPHPVFGGEFGATVAIEDDVLLIGSPGGLSDSGDTGICYLYRLDGNEWVLDSEIISSDIAVGDHFGSAISIDNGYAVISSSGKDGGVGGLYFYSVADCNENGIADGCDIQDGFSNDVNNDGIPDDCLLPSWSEKPASIFESFANTNSMAWGDFDNDGDDDIFLAAGAGKDNRLLRNDQGLGFIDITPFVIKKRSFDNYSAAWGDCNLDGNLDLFIAADGVDFLFLGNGDGTFSEPAVASIQVNRTSRSAGWGDINGDGYLDIAIAQMSAGATVHINTMGLLGSFGFTAVEVASSAQGLAWMPSLSGGRQDLVLGAYSNDLKTLTKGLGDTDIVVLPNTGLEQLGLPGRSTSLVTADFNNDGRLDVLVTTETVGYPSSVGSQAIGLQNVDGTFTSQPVPALDFDANVYSAVAFDYDNDGDQDIYLTIDHPTFTNRFYLNDGTGQFSRLEDYIVDLHGRSLCVTWHDADDDGDLDLYLVRENKTNKIFENLIDNGNHWLRVRPKGQTTSVNAVGVTIELYYSGGTQIRQISGGGDNFLGQNPQYAHFGLGVATTIDSLKIHWTAGLATQTIYGSVINVMGVDREIVVTESGGVSAVRTSDTPSQLAITSVYPNPFNPTTQIKYWVPQSGQTEVSILDVRGRLVKRLISESLSVGPHEVVWRGVNKAGESVPSGAYFLRISSGGEVESRKITLLK